MAVTLQDIAERAGVSRGTVDRAMNNRGRIRPEVAERIRKIADEMGYRPNRAGKALAMARRSVCIGVILQEVETAFMRGILDGIKAASEELEHLGASVILKEIEGLNTKAVIDAMEELRVRRVHAIALNPSMNKRTKETIDRFVTEHGIPIVTFNTDLEDCRRLCYIGQNTYQCGRAAAGLMGEIIGGEGKVAVITGHEVNPSLKKRVEGFRDEIDVRFPKIEIVGVQYAYNSDTIAENLTRELMEQYPEIKGLFLTVNVEQGVCAALEKEGKIGNVKIISNDLNENNCKMLRDGKVTFMLEQNARVQGYEPVMVLFRLLFDGEKPQYEFQYTDLTIRTGYNLPSDRATACDGKNV